MAETNNLVVLMFEGVETAAAVYEKIEQMEKEKLLAVADAIIIERGEGIMPLNMAPTVTASEQPAAPQTRDEVTVKQTHGKKGKYAAGGGGIGLLAGFLLGGPIGGLIVGAGLGALTAAMKDFGIDDENIAVIKARLQPNSSALMLLGRADDRDALLAELRTFDPQVIMTSLSPEAEKALREQLEG